LLAIRQSSSRRAMSGLAHSLGQMPGCCCGR
jgi:hypothetical protein